MKNVLIIGGASAIASETAKCFAKEGAKIFLADINLQRLESVKDDIFVTSKKTEIYLSEFDATQFESHQKFFTDVIQTLGDLDVVLIAHGTLPNQELLNKEPDKIIKEFNINSLSVISLCSIVANYFEGKKSGTIAVISSVAGDRGRQSNYIYGAAKGSVSIFLSGLRNRLYKSNVNVITIKPGFVDTPMTANMPKNALYASPKTVGESIYKAINAKKDIVYVPGFWRLIMCIIKHIPETIFKKLNL